MSIDLDVEIIGAGDGFFLVWVVFIQKYVFTNLIEGTWTIVKFFLLRHRTRKSYYDAYFAEYMYYCGSVLREREIDAKCFFSFY